MDVDFARAGGWTQVSGVEDGFGDDFGDVLVAVLEFAVDGDVRVVLWGQVQVREKFSSLTLGVVLCFVQVLFFTSNELIISLVFRG